MKKIYIIAIFGILLLPNTINSEEISQSSVVINEIAAYESSDHEWIEIYVTSEEPVDLTDWKFYENETNHGLELYQGESVVLEPGEYAIIADVAENFIVDYPEFAGKVFDSSWSSLKEGGEEIGLVNSSGDFVELFTYISSSDFSLERADPYLMDYTEENWQEHESSNTVGQENSNYVEYEPDLIPPEEISDLQVGMVMELSWQPSPSEDTAGYILQIEGEEGYGLTIDVGDVIFYELSDLVYGQNYDFKIIAYDLSGNESDEVETGLAGPVCEISECPECVYEECVEYTECEECEVCPEPEEYICEEDVGCEECVECLECESCPEPEDCILEECQEIEECPACEEREICLEPEPCVSQCEVCPAPEVCPETEECPEIEECPVCPSASSGSGDEDKHVFTYLPSDLVINEFVADPSDGEEEWVELYNNMVAIVDLEGWTLEEGSGSITDLSGQIAANGFVIIEPRGNLNNGGDIIILKDPGGLIIDQVTYGDWDDGEINDNAPKAQDPYSVARLIDGLDDDSDLDDWLVTTVVTKGAKNIIEELIEAGSPSIISSAITDDQSVVYSDKIIVNEFLPNPKGSDTESEWIELRNTGSSAVDLEGWRLSDSTARKYTIKKDDFTSTMIQAQGYFVLYKDKTGISLNNSSGDKVRLFQPENDEPIDEVEYSEKAEDDASYAKTSDGGWGWTTSLTPGERNVITADEDPSTEFEADETDSLTDPIDMLQETVEETLDDQLMLREQDIELVVTEVVPNPEGPDDYEWIEILNMGQKVNLKGCKIDDEEGGSKPYEIQEDLSLEYLEYLVLRREETKIALNNSGDSVRVFDSNDKLVDQVDIEDVEEGASYALAEDGKWSWTSVETPGGENVIKINEDENEDKDKIVTKKSGSKNAPIIETDLMGARKVEIGRVVKVQGVVSVVPGIFNSQIFYLSGSGMQVYMYKKDFPEMRVGDKVEIVGELALSNGERRIKVKAREDIAVLEHVGEPEPHEVELASVNETAEGHLVTISGQVIEKKGSTIYLDNGAEEVEVYVKRNANIDKKNIEEGDELKVTGIVSRNKDGYQVLPREQGDVEVVSSMSEAQVLGAEYVGSSGGNVDVQRYLWVGLFFVGVTLAVVGWRRREAVSKLVKSKVKN